MLEELQNNLNQSVRTLAEKSLLKKLSKQGVSKEDITSKEYEYLVSLEADLIKADGKKVGVGVAIGVGISLLTGGLF